MKLRTRPCCKSTVRPTTPVTTLWTRVMSRMRSVGRVWVETQSIEDARRSRCRYSPITTGSSTTCVQTQPTPRISTFSPRCSLQCSSSCAGSRSSQIVATIRDATAPLPMHTASCRALCAMHQYGAAPTLVEALLGGRYAGTLYLEDVLSVSRMLRPVRGVGDVSSRGTESQSHHRP